MAKVTKLHGETFEVSGFVQSMTNLVYEVTFTSNEARVTARSGCTDETWDKHAISAVQSALILDTVQTR
jgi:hypothetical protein